MTPSIPSEPSRSQPAAWLVSQVVALVAVAIPVLYFLRYQGGYFGWGDEVQFVDPAASAHFGQGFTSMAWPYQGAGEFFAGNASGYSMLLVPWFALLGFGLDQARWLNLPLAVVAGLLMWGGLGRVAPSLPVWLRGFAVGVAFLGFGVLVSTGSARYDVLGILVGAWLFFLFSSGARSAWPLVLAGAAVFHAGFHLVAAVVVVLMLLVLQDRRRFLRPAAVVVAGIAAGMAALLALLATQGLLRKFFIMLFGSQHTISGQMAKFARGGASSSNPLLAKLHGYEELPVMDPSLSLLAIFLLVMLVLAWRGRTHLGERLAGWLALDFVFILPAVLLFIGKFPVYYDWMAFMPAVLVGSVWAWRLRERGVSWPLQAFIIFAVAAGGAGLWKRTSQSDMRAGSPMYAEFNRWAADGLKPSDWVYTDFEAYFVARGVAQRVVSPTYAQSALLPGIPERDQVTAMTVQRANAPKVTELMGGRWKEVSAFRAADLGGHGRPLDFVLLRRDP